MCSAVTVMPPVPPIRGAENVLLEMFTVSSHALGGSHGVTTSTESYRALLERLRELDGSVFTASEAQSVRDAADAQLFGDADRAATVERALALMDVLVEAARLSSRTRGILADLLGEIESVGAPSG